MNTATQSIETKLAVKEVYSFNEAWKLATVTKERFDYYQGMEQKIGYMKQAERWFVTADGILYYSYKTDDGVRIIHEANPISSLTNHDFQYIQMMVSPNKEYNPTGAGFLRFTGQYVTRKNAIEITKQGEVFAFNK